jgi:glycosyltransferase involved in cell wall biosynthesis
MKPKKNARVLVISNNPLSEVGSNGKTIASFLRKIPRSDLAQLYFDGDEPNFKLAARFFRITDSEVIRGVLFRKPVGRSLEAASGTNNYSSRNIKFEKLKKLESFRFFRELAWGFSKYNYGELKEWVLEFNPSVILFCAGDSLFAYKFFYFLSSICRNSKKIVYVTDDYILPRRRFSPFFWLRRSLILKHMKSAVLSADLFVTISECMRREYYNILGKDSITLFNVPDKIKIEDFKKSKRPDLFLVYAGGLHFRRWEVLREIGLGIKAFNEKYNRNVELKVYSHQSVEEELKAELEIDQGSCFYGALNSLELRRVLNDADALIHVESFERRCVESTKLSISTKIAECLAAGKAFLAVGPAEVASMNFVKGSAYCVNSLQDMPSSIEEFLINHVESDVNNERALATLRSNMKIFEHHLLS